MSLPKLRKIYNFVINYEDVELGTTKRFHVEAPTASIAVARCIGWIDNHNIPKGEEGYHLSTDMAKIVNGKARPKDIDYHIKWSDEN